ncbi:MAG: GNAT family N-acetyltransferase [Actinomycetota bacterium]|nr:GNAT family N-acetyltransferase [Actinomycetota bacterium]
MGGIIVREPRAGDGPAIARFHRENAAYYAEVAPEHFRVPDAEGLGEFMEPGPDENTETTLALVAELDGEVVGYLEAHLLPPLETARYQAQADVGETRLVINYVETLQKHWRQGVGSRLVEAAEEWGRAREATVAVCDTYIGSPVSIPFWEERMGYERRAIIFRKALA